MYSDLDLLYLNNVGRKSFQWEIWQCCNQLCKYCYLGKDNRHTDKQVQMQSITDFYKAIEHLDCTKYNNISIIGGEMFQGQMDDPEIHDWWLKCQNLIIDRYLNKEIGSVWMTCTMTLGDNKHLYETLDLWEKRKAFPHKLYPTSGLWLCTSWDAQGRFYTKDREETFNYHVQNINKKYPWIKFNTTIILMDKLLDMYLAGEFKPLEFMKKYKTTIFYKQCGMPAFKPFSNKKDEIFKEWSNFKLQMNESVGFTFVPKREKFLKFLQAYAINDRSTFDKLFNIVYRADELHRHFNDGSSTQMDRIKQGRRESIMDGEGLQNTCGHLLNYAAYVDNNDCCICDRDLIYESVYGISPYEDTFYITPSTFRNENDKWLE